MVIEPTEFHNGDRVEIIDIDIVDPKRKLHNGSTGTVVHVDSPDSLCIEYDDYIDGHNGGGCGRDGHCWWTPAKALELLSEEHTTVTPASIDSLYAFLGI